MMNMQRMNAVDTLEAMQCYTYSTKPCASAWRRGFRQQLRVLTISVKVHLRDTGLRMTYDRIGRPMAVVSFGSLLWAQ